MAYQGGYKLWDRDALGVATHRKIVYLGNLGNKCALQWILHQATGSASAISVYTAADTNGKLLGEDGEAALLDPATNPRWSTTPIAFAALPAAAIGSSHQPFDRPGPFILIEVVCNVAMPEFSLLIWGAGNI